ncbi:MAG: non-homologous end-joining DNA ligase [Povalibacter sp.]
MKRPLEKYAAKRKFTKTPEPAPKVVDRKGPLLFMVQKHAARRLHYDFRLELDGVLKSWAIPKGPSLQVGEKRLAVEVEDHPFDYASFEGVIPEKEYGAGNVIVWDCGVYSPDEGGKYSFADRSEAEDRLRRELANGKLSIFLRGEKLKGSFALVRTSTEKQWLLIKHKDRFAGVDTLLAQNTSVLSGVTLDEIASAEARERMSANLLAPTGPEEEMPAQVLPMLADSGDEPRSHADWMYEPKLDGYRVISYIEGETVFLQSRRGLDLTPLFPELVLELKDQHIESMILDGEIVALDKDGRPSFNALQNRAQVKGAKELATAQRESPVIYLCFDLLHFAGLNLRNATYLERRRYLTQCLLPSAHVQLVHTSPNAEQLYEASLKSGFEGIVAKRKEGTYQPGKRTANWVKFKSTQTAEFVVGGYTQGRGGRGALGALVLGYFKGNELHYVGHSGSGFNDQAIDETLKRAAELKTKSSPFVTKPPLNAPVTWLRPEMVAEIRFDSWTPDGHLRSPVFLRLRDDIEPDSIRSGPEKKRPTAKPTRTPSNEVEGILEQLNAKTQSLDLNVGDAKIRVTNLDREYWPADKNAKLPALTKRDHLRYLARVGRFMIPHLRDRPLTMIRMPEGIDGERFFQKHWEQAKPDFVETITVYSEHNEGAHDYILGNNLPTLLWLGQVGTLEFHVWHSRAKLAPDATSKSDDYSSSIESMEASVLNYPDYLVFDIDPYIYSGKEPKGAEPELNKKGFAMGKRVAFWIHEVLKQMSLTARVKTSGKTGLHVFVPIDRTVTFDEARHLCEMVGRHVMQAHPKDITMEWAIVKRTGKIFIDYNMNVRGKTLNVAYSPRGVPGAPVSMPLTWEELEAAEPMHFTMRNVLERLEKAGDRWHDVLSVKQNLAKVFGSNGRK